jgi:pyruvate formate lyase activating enzyme
MKPNLEAASPFELRVGLGQNVPESDVRKALASGDMGFVHSFTTGSTLDGPGVRIVAWLSGCQFRCIYCHNPDTWNMGNGIPVTIERARTQLKKYRAGVKAMKGGLTISGGEPLMQHKFVLKLFGAAKELGIHTALDTNGSLGGRLSDEELQLIDLVLLDLKAWTPSTHQALVASDNAPVLDFARRLAELKRPVWIRFVLVPGYTDAPEEFGGVAGFAAGLGNVERVDVLPFHQMGGYKWKQLGLDYSLADAAPPSADLIETVCRRFRAAGLKAY